MTSNSWLLRGILTPLWNEEDVQSHLNLKRHGYISAFTPTNGNNLNNGETVGHQLNKAGDPGFIITL